MDRRSFISGAAAAAGALATGGCRSLFETTSFYGPTIRDRIWMWGHHVETAKMAASCAKEAPERKKNFVWPGRAVDQTEGCRLMGIPNNCVIRWLGKPTYPWGDYFEQFRSLKRFSFGVKDEGKESVEEKMRICFEELQPRFPNLTGCFLDDYFLSRRPNYVPDIRQLEKIHDAVHDHGLRLSAVAYSDQGGIKPAYKPHMSLVDEISFWFWKSSNIPTMADQIRKCRDFIGPDKDLLLGLYMWDFSTAQPVSADLMGKQLAFAERFLADRTIDGLLFHPTFAAALDVPAVNLSKEWIAAHGDKPWGV